MDLPCLELSPDLELQVCLTESGKPRQDVKKIITEARNIVGPGVTIWAYISGPKRFIENAKTVYKAMARVDYHAASWDIQTAEILLRYLQSRNDVSIRGSKMIEPLVALATFATYLFINAHPTEAVATFSPTCWEDAETAPTIKFKECIDVVNQQVIHGRDLNLPLKFSQDPTLEPDIQLPASWWGRTSNCFVGMTFRPGRTGYDRVSLKDIKLAAQAIGIECVIKPPHRGGVVHFGWYDKMGVFLLATPPLGRDNNGTQLTE
ncbi:MAG: hypothetical protein Q9179_004306 [Wetmoreana sp. 5 TL-2023]